MNSPSQADFAAASAFFVRVVESIPDNEWEYVGLGSWNIRDLVAHANRAHTTIEEYLSDPRPPEQPGSSYFSEESIAARGREAVTALGANPCEAVAATACRVRRLVDESPAHAMIGSPARTMTLGEYLPSRTAELTIHGLDVAHAIGRQISAPADALRASLDFITRWGVAKGHGELILRALSGRGELPSHFSMY